MRILKSTKTYGLEQKMGNEKKVLIISQSIYGDGIGSVTSTLAFSLLKRNIRVDIACFREFSFDNNITKDFVKKKCNLYRISRMRGLNYFQFARDLNHIFEKNNYDIIHIHMGLFSWIAARIAKKHLIKKRVAHAHGKVYPSRHPKLFDLFIRYPSQLLCKYYCTDEIGCTEYSNIYNFGKERIVIPNYISEKEIFEVSYDTISSIRRRITNKQTDTKVFCYFGNINRNKNVIFLVKVFEELKKRHYKSKLVICGNGVMKKMVEEEIKKTGLNEEISLLGYCSNCNEIVQACDYYISASYSEGMSIAMIQAQMAGKMCIASETIGHESDLGIDLFYYIDAMYSHDPFFWAEKIIELDSKIKTSIERDSALRKIQLKGLDEKTIIKKILQVYGV